MKRQIMGRESVVAITEGKLDFGTTGYEKTILSGLQGAWGIFREAVVNTGTRPQII